MSSIDRQTVPVEAAPRTDRRPRLLRASMSAFGRQPQEILVRNVSSHGLGGSSRGECFAAGEHVQIVLPGDIRVSGVVRWAKARSFGVELDEQLSMEAVGEALQRATPAAASWEVQRQYKLPGQPDPSMLRRL